MSGKMRQTKVMRVGKQLPRKTKKGGVAANPQPDHVRKSALVMLGDGIGNIVEQTPLVAAVCTLYKTVDIWCPRTSRVWSGLLDDLPGVRKIYWEKAGYLTITQDTDGAQYSALFATFLTPKFNQFINRKGTYQCKHPRGTKRSERDVCMDAARAAGFAAATPKPYVSVGKWRGVDLPKPYVVVSGGGKPRPMWRWKRYKKYHEVVNAVRAERPDITFVNLGGAQDEYINADGIVDLRDQTTLREVAAIMKGAEAFVGNDCGLAHMAAALEVPTTVVFGPTTVTKNLPPTHARAVFLGLRCQPCQYSKKGMARYPEGGICKHECMSDLDGAKIAASVMEDLNG